MMRFKENNYNRVFVGLSNLIRYICGGDRLRRITKIIDELLKKKHLEKNRKLKILDFGCGSMEVSKKLRDKIYVGQIVGSDIFKHRFKSNKIVYIDNDELFKKKEKFDIIFIVDVLHHIGVEDAHKIIRKLFKLSNNIIIKDHFEHSYLSRQLLRLVDFYANYGYGVNIPKKYFDKTSWKKTLIKSNCREIFHSKNFQQHDGLFNFILNKKHHFVSVIKSNE
jgi:SAM-dependent methyltransferase